MSAREGCSSALAPHIEGLVARKRALGFEYAAHEALLVRIDRLCIAGGFDEPVVTRELSAAWAEASSGEGAGSKAGRMSALRQLALYERSIGLDAYVPGRFAGREKSAVYLPTPEETAALFAAIDAYGGDRRWPRIPCAMRSSSTG